MPPLEQLLSPPWLPFPLPPLPPGLDGRVTFAPSPPIAVSPPLPAGSPAPDAAVAAATAGLPYGAAPPIIPGLPDFGAVVPGLPLAAPLPLAAAPPPPSPLPPGAAAPAAPMAVDAGPRVETPPDDDIELPADLINGLSTLGSNDLMLTDDLSRDEVWDSLFGGAAGAALAQQLNAAAAAAGPGVGGAPPDGGGGAAASTGAGVSQA
jgi:hypothetical protein